MFGNLRGIDDHQCSQVAGNGAVDEFWSVAQ